MRNLTKVEEHSRRMVQNWLFGLEIDRSNDDENGFSDDGHYISDYDYPSSEYEYA